MLSGGRRELDRRLVDPGGKLGGQVFEVVNEDVEVGAADQIARHHVVEDAVVGVLAASNGAREAFVGVGGTEGRRVEVGGNS